ncbi:MAG TPA: ATP-binding protein [Xanthobacteraceae bacterium]|nr:ATP-binding protein [Xanthobacteraceae bacterium]
MMIEERLLLLALRGRDSDVITQLLIKQGYVCHSCADATELADQLDRGAGTAILTEESLVGADRQWLDDWLNQQPAWSDFPFILLATKRSGRRPAEAVKVLERLGNVVVLERPIHGETLASAVKSSLRVRRRQYEARYRLIELQKAEDRLMRLNASLEARIAERTRELSQANNQLMQEISERERAQSALAQSQKMEAVGQLTGGIAHDFNNLLTVISGNLELIKRRSAEERTIRLADFASQAATRASKLTSQLLAFSRTQQLSLAPVNINALVEAMNDLLERTIGPQIEKRLSLEPQEPWVNADVNQLELAILNLALNARDAMPGGGTLTIATSIREIALEGRPSATYGVVSVTDTGTGIPDDLLPKVFDPFFTTKPVGRGTGLGLSQVFGISQQSGGTTQVMSEEGRGTTVSIFLPVSAAQLQTDGLKEMLVPATSSSDDEIVVIDDDDGVRTFIVESLQSLGYSVRAASNGAAGLALIKNKIPDLLLVDFAMAGMTGLDVIREVRCIEPTLPTILATGYAEMDSIEQAASSIRILRKPFQIDQLAGTIQELLNYESRVA